jgi:hypothetical protein
VSTSTTSSRAVRAGIAFLPVATHAYEERPVHDAPAVRRLMAHGRRPMRPRSIPTRRARCGRMQRAAIGGMAGTLDPSRCSVLGMASRP